MSPLTRSKDAGETLIPCRAPGSQVVKDRMCVRNGLGLAAPKAAWGPPEGPELGAPWQGLDWAPGQGLNLGLPGRAWTWGPPAGPELGAPRKGLDLGAPGRA